MEPHTPFQPSSSEMLIEWTGFSDDGHGVVNYSVAVEPVVIAEGEARPAVDGFMPVGAHRSALVDGLALEHDVQYL